jgi:tight adherence protein C
MTWSLTLFLLLAIVIAAVIFFTVVYGNRRQIRARLKRVRELENDDEAMLDKPFRERVVEPAGKALSGSLLHIAPREMQSYVEKQLTYAGHPWNLTFQKLLVVQVLLALLLPLSLLLAVTLAGTVEGTKFINLFLLGLAGFFFPLALIRYKAVQRQEEISKAMPLMLDLLLISVEAGMSLDMAMRKVSASISGPLRPELQRFQEEVQMGKPRSEALKAMVERTGVEDLWLFTISIVQAEQRWGNIAEALEKQAFCLRRKRRRRAEEEARKAPLKMLFPLVFFVFPAMYLILLGPALLQIYKVMGNLF